MQNCIGKLKKQYRFLNQLRNRPRVILGNFLEFVK